MHVMNGQFLIKNMSNHPESRLGTGGFSKRNRMDPTEQDLLPWDIHKSLVRIFGEFLASCEGFKLLLDSDSDSKFGSKAWN
jgi:hypothetical protein